MPLLAIQEITKEYDGIRALDRVSMTVQTRTIKGLIGPNGAGKSTLFHLVSGIERPTSGEIYFKGRKITGLEPYEIATHGIGRTFQTVQTLANMTVAENVMAAMHLRMKGGWISSGLWLPSIRRKEKAALKEAKEILEGLGLLGRWKSPAFQLSLGQQRLLEIGRALAMKPELILLDEPASGLTPTEVGELSRKLLRFKEEGVTLFIVEHHMGIVMEIADEVVVLDHGNLIAEGPPDAIREDSKVIEAYLKGKRTRA
jgi:branched-chain amino acid transport system ATP-binding protein